MIVSSLDFWWEEERFLALFPQADGLTFGKREEWPPWEQSTWSLDWITSNLFFCLSSYLLLCFFSEYLSSAVCFNLSISLCVFLSLYLSLFSHSIFHFSLNRSSLSSFPLDYTRFSSTLLNNLYMSSFSLNQFRLLRKTRLKHCSRRVNIMSLKNQRYRSEGRILIYRWSTKSELPKCARIDHLLYSSLSLSETYYCIAYYQCLYNINTMGYQVLNM